jgi:hypothetical protein
MPVEQQDPPGFRTLTGHHKGLDQTQLRDRPGYTLILAGAPYAGIQRTLRANPFQVDDLNPSLERLLEWLAGHRSAATRSASCLGIVGIATARNRVSKFLSARSCRSALTTNTSRSLARSAFLTCSFWRFISLV